jgi:Fe-S oxidoreductase
MRMMATGGTRQDRLGWLDGGLKSDPERGRVFLWTGCTIYYDAFFPELGVRTVEGTRAALRLLNRLGEVPVVSPEERCCGHDLAWNGDRTTFEALARRNVELVRSSGAELLVAPCAECARTWRMDYAPFLAGLEVQVLHLSEYLAEHLDELELGDGGAGRVTYQDPCRLGRHLGVTEAPRTVLRGMPGLELVEMARSGARAVCCAGGTWSSCDRYAKQIQVGRLREARATGADVMVTACPKCQVHLRCAMQGPKPVEIEMRDLAEVVSAALT